MKACKSCKDSFEPAKSYFVFCPECASRGLARCKLCGTAVVPDTAGVYRCCGKRETIEHVKLSERLQARRIAEVFAKAGVFNDIELYGYEEL